MSAPYEKAIEETAKTAGKAIDAASDTGKFAARVFGSTINELAGWSHDVILAKRLGWQANNVDKFVENVRKLKGAGSVIKPVPARQASLLLEAVSNEDDPDIQALWAKLIDAATDGTNSYEIKRVHIDVLRSIDPIEAKIIAAVAKFLSERPSDVRVLFGELLAGEVGVDIGVLTVYLHHLASLGCFIAGDKTTGFAAEPSPPPSQTVETPTADFQVTELLVSLLEVI